MITLYRYYEMRECEDILHILPRMEQCSRRTTHSGRIIAAYQQQLLEGTSPGLPLQQLRTCNILNNIIVNATGTFPHTLRLIIQTTDKFQARSSTITVHLRRAYYLQDLQHLLQPTRL
jgi:hypothetical protein